MSYRSERSRRVSPPPAPLTPPCEEMFNDWYEAIRPILLETWLAGFEANTNRSSPHQPIQTPPLNQSNGLQGAIWELPDDQMPEGWRKVQHRLGEYPCYRTALIITRFIRIGEKFSESPDLLRLVNGNKVTPNSPATCGFCGHELYQLTTNTDLDWAPHILPPSGKETVSFQDEHTDKPDIFQIPDVLSGLDSPISVEELDGEVPTMTLEAEEEALRQLAVAMGVGPDDGSNDNQ